MKSDCYKCKHRSDVPGSAHSSCNAISKENQSAALICCLLYSKIGKNDNIVFHPHGVKNGWCSYPYDFDPGWVEKCDLFEEKQ